MAQRRALLSVSDKRGLVELARALVRHDFELLSTGGTLKELAGAGLPVTSVSSYTGAPEILEGRVKTLHPKIHGGLLARPTPAHEAELREHQIPPIDLVVVNLYPFLETIARPDVALADAIEQIDVGGPTMIRAAAKTYERVGVVVDPDDYARVIVALDAGGGALPRALRFELAQKVFAHTAAYDAAVAGYLGALSAEDAARDAFPETLTLQWKRARPLRYGENPHQSAAFYVEAGAPAGTLARGEVLGGKELSYNNLLDLDAAWGAVCEHAGPAVVIVKHTNPCGVGGSADGVAAAYRLAHATDPTSAFGGIVAANRAVDAAMASELTKIFLECVIAPSFDAEARTILAEKKNLRLVATGGLPAAVGAGALALRSVGGGLLVQSPDAKMVAAADAKVVTKRAPTPEELAGLDFVWRVAKHVKSNAIVFGRGGQTAAIGAGQMSRVDSVKIAVSKAQLPVKGSVAASDAFFPFRDGLDALAQAGATAVIQPGGSVKDAEVIAAADEQGVAMLFTGTRHFRH